MNWLQRYRFRLYIRNSLWILPALSIPVALFSVSLLSRYERAIGSQTKVSTETVRALMNTVAASTFTLVVLVSSAVLLAVQLAGADSEGPGLRLAGFGQGPVLLGIIRIVAAHGFGMADQVKVHGGFSG